MDFKERRLSSKRAFSILAKSGIIVDDNEASIILDFLYLMAKNYNRVESTQKIRNVNKTSNVARRS